MCAGRDTLIDEEQWLGSVGESVGLPFERRRLDGRGGDGRHTDDCKSQDERCDANHPRHYTIKVLSPP